MTRLAAALLADVRTRGARVSAVGDRLRIEFDPGLLPDNIIEECRTQKPEILEFLRVEDRLRGACTEAGCIGQHEDSGVRLVGRILTRFGGEIVAVTQTPPAPVEPPSSHNCRACHGRSFWVSHAGVATCGRCHPPAGSFLVRVWLNDGVGRPVEDGS